MAVTGTHTHRLHIERYRSEIVVAAAHPNRVRIKNDLDAAISDRLPATLRAALAPLFRTGDEGIVLIRRLDVPLTVNSRWSRERCVKRFATEVSRTLAQTVQAGGDDVIRFPDRAAYLAQFLADLAAGHAWGAWYYQAFRGLRALSTSAALRTTVCEEPSIGLAALLKLSAVDTERVVAALTAGDAARILNRLPQGSRADEEGFERLWRTWNAIGMSAPTAEDESRHAIRLVIETCRRHPEEVGGGLGAMAQALVRMARRLSEMPTNAGPPRFGLTPADLLDAVTQNDVARLAPLRHVRSQRLRSVARALVDGRPAPGPAHANAQRTTPLGGVFLLLPFVDRLPVAEATVGWPDLRKSTAADFARFVIMMKCLGRSRASRLFHDALIRDLMMVDPCITWEDARAWFAQRSRIQLDHLLAVMATWQAEERSIAGRDFEMTAVPLRGAPAMLIADRARGIWLYAAGYSTRRPQPLAGRLGGWMTRAHLDPERLSAPPALYDGIRRAFPDAAVTEDPRKPSERSATDMRALTLMQAFRGARPADLALAVVAQQVMRAFARRLPGFADSSQPYLFANMLDLPAVVEEEPDRRLVRLGRPPLQYVIGMSGLARGSYRLSRRDDTPFILFQE